MPEDTYSHEGPKCPHCGRQFTADEPHYYDEMRYTRDDCDECGKPFSVSVHVSTTWSCEPIETNHD
jgi:rRNA maturation protein Nop10